MSAPFGSPHRCGTVAFPRNGNLPWTSGRGNTTERGIARSGAAPVSNRTLGINAGYIVALLATVANLFT